MSSGFLGLDNGLRHQKYRHWAKAYKMLGEIEQCVTELREFYRRCTIMGSAHALGHVHKVLRSLDEDGYGEVRAVKDFREELAEVRA